MKKIIALMLVIGIAFCATGTPVAWAEGEKYGAATASAILPGVGQIMNDDHATGSGKAKIGLMWLIELGAIITTPILGATVGWPIVMVGVAIFAINHVWSARDAYDTANVPSSSTMGSKSR
jgi:hypothetical protein